ncbi:hypothetical protein [Brevibacillus sp. SYSU BS000544]|uniref:hypothetical protein n=1 Tax=Brevibacillus sp. SYSU BS000544 TaxID=3416443 RepID=UPI003CE4E602
MSRLFLSSVENGSSVNTKILPSVVIELDGQQRLQGIYTGLKGVDVEGEELFLNLLENAKEFGLMYDFRFLSEEERDQLTETQYSK